MNTIVFPNIEKANNSLTVPELNEATISFCKSFAPESEPQYVPNRPEAFADTHKCAYNVLEKVRRDGGQLVLGWEIGLVPQLWVSGDFHVVWKSPKGELIDITPHTPKRETTLFLEDNFKWEIKGGDFIVNESAKTPASKRHVIGDKALIKKIEDLIAETDYYRRCRDWKRTNKCKSEMDKVLGKIYSKNI